MLRFFIAAAVIGVLSFLPGFAQTAVQQASQPTTGVPAPAGTDEAGRPVQPVGTEAPLQVPETRPDQKQAFCANVKDRQFQIS
jgi:hypothetical protein